MPWEQQIGGRLGTRLESTAWRAKNLMLPLLAMSVRLSRRSAGIRRFHVDDQVLDYFVHPYNATWRNERCVELAVAFDWLDRRPTGRTLEIGHVLGHYRSLHDHTVVDKYEAAPDVVNADAMDYRPAVRFRSIMAISTLEHVGYDEEEQDPDKTRRLVDHLATLLTPDGELLITFPLGYNRELDAHLVSGTLGFDHLAVLRRTSALGAWEQADLDHLPHARYGFPFRNGNSIAVGRRRAPALVVPKTGTEPLVAAEFVAASTNR